MKLFTQIRQRLTCRHTHCLGALKEQGTSRRSSCWLDIGLKADELDALCLDLTEGIFILLDSYEWERG